MLLNNFLQFSSIWQRNFVWTCMPLSFLEKGWVKQRTNISALYYIHLPNKFPSRIRVHIWYVSQHRFPKARIATRNKVRLSFTSLLYLNMNHIIMNYLLSRFYWDVFPHSKANSRWQNPDCSTNYFRYWKNSKLKLNTQWKQLKVFREVHWDSKMQTKMLR